MHFAPEAVSAETAATFRRVISIVGWDAWKNRIRDLEAQTKHNPFITNFFNERFAIEIAFGEIREHFLATGRFADPKTAEQYRCYAFLAMIARVHQRLNQHGRRQLAGAIQKGLNGDFGLGPLAFEMRVAAELMRRNFDVEFSDLELGGGFDFLATRDEYAVEIECKHVSGDIGRKIPKHFLYKLGETLAPILGAARPEVGRGLFVDVTIPSNLTRGLDQHRSIADIVSRTLATRENAENADCFASLQTFDSNEISLKRRSSIADAEAAFRDYVSKRFGLQTSNLLAIWGAANGTLLFSIKSSRPDAVLTKILRTLKDDTDRQFSKQLPAVLFVHFADLTQENLLELATEERRGRVTGLQRMASILLGKRPHLHTAVFMADGDVLRRETQDGEAKRVSIQESGKTYYFVNHEHPAANLITL